MFTTVYRAINVANEASQVDVRSVKTAHKCCESRLRLVLMVAWDECQVVENRDSFIVKGLARSRVWKCTV